ncbi:MAG: hypothetical protein KKC68_04040 [Candidatus Thermoplasmatota archaeon]|nr:hypothetical protein [Candidatus Thermoplasmatota archaeon]MBU1940922.1 hypothetical protein [Candidatus Thermoplasmatota archaeon]
MKQKIVLIFGILFLIGFVLLLIGSSFIFISMAVVTGPDGYIASEKGTFSIETYALSSQDITIDKNIFIPNYLQWLAPEDGILVKLMGSSQNTSKEIFMGLGSANDVQNYLDNIEHEEAIYYHWRISSTAVSLELDGASYHTGDSPLKAPAEETFWLLSGQGSLVTLSTAMQSGTYRLVFMNADGSSQIDADLVLAARFPFMERTALLMLVVGIVLGIIGVYLVYFRYVKKK